MIGIIFEGGTAELQSDGKWVSQDAELAILLNSFPQEMYYQGPANGSRLAAKVAHAARLVGGQAVMPPVQTKPGVVY